MSRKAKTELVIFDCDGVLVDSEALENQLLIDMAARHGLNVDADEAHREFVGRKLAECVQHMERTAGGRLPDTFIPDYRQELTVIVARELKPVTGIRSALQQIDHLACVATNGPQEKMRQALDVTGLRPFFADRLFSAYDINAWKPAPDLFLFAAKTMGVPPDNCVVVEDSPPGIAAAQAAGMAVIAYRPMAAPGPGVVTIDAMSELPKALSHS